MMLRVVWIMCLVFIVVFPPLVRGQGQGFQLMEDVVYLKNGGIVRGMIYEQVLGESLKIHTQDGSVFVFEIEEISRITKEPPVVNRSAQAPRMEDVVYLKNGGIVRGMIYEQVPWESLKIHTQDGSVFVFEMGEISRITKEPPVPSAANVSVSEIEGISRITKRPRRFAFGPKNPGLAFVLSLLITGGGQIYNEQYEKAAAQAGLAIFGAVLVLEDSGDNADIGAILWISAVLWSIIDAPISANEINLQSQSASRIEVRIDPMVSREGAGAMVALRW